MFAKKSYKMCKNIGVLCHIAGLRVCRINGGPSFLSGERCVSVGFVAGEDKKYVKHINPAIRKEIQDAKTGEK